MLDKILERKREEVEQRKRTTPLAALAINSGREPRRSLLEAISGGGVKLIAEVKRASPSRGLLCPDFDPVSLAESYQRGGASAISVLTEVNYFQGSLDYLAAIRARVTLPLLRKDFIFDPYQVYESAAAGADALLLIAAILPQAELESLLAMSRRLGLECLVETHNEGEINRAAAAGASIIGINNRDLATFAVDIDTTRRLRPLVPAGLAVVSESGLSRREDIRELARWGVNAALVGEALVTAGDVAARIRELLP